MRFTFNPLWKDSAPAINSAKKLSKKTLQQSLDSKSNFIKMQTYFSKNAYMQDSDCYQNNF